jgi:hypothetical protein
MTWHPHRYKSIYESSSISTPNCPQDREVDTAPNSTQSDLMRQPEPRATVMEIASSIDFLTNVATNRYADVGTEVCEFCARSQST